MNQFRSWRIPCGAAHLVFQFVMDLDHMMVELSVYLLDEMMRDQKIRQMYQSQSWRMLCCVTYLVYQLVMDFDHLTVRLLVHLLDDMMRHQKIQ